MKKIKLLLAAMAAMVGLGAQAQSWTASEVGAGNFMLYNVGTGQYLTKGNGWGTQASITTAATAGNGIAVTLESVSGNFKIRTDINGDGKGLEHLDGGTVYTDQSAGKNSTWTFTQVSTDNGPVYNIVSADNHGGGAGAYLTAGVDGTIVTPGNDGSIDGAKWKLMAIPAQPVGMAEASEENPVDVTSLIVNQNFSFPTILKSGTGSWTMEASNQNLCGGDVTNPCAESWRSSFTLSQTITVPNGYYKLRAQAALTEYTVTGANFPVVYATSGANTVSTPFLTMQNGENSMSGMSTQFTNGNYFTNYTDVIIVSSGSLTVGVKGTRTDTWCIWDNFQLVYMGPIDLSAYATELANAVSAVEAIEGSIPTAAYTSLNAVVDEYNKSYDNSDDYVTAIAAINAAYNAAQSLVSAYAHYKEIRTAALAVNAGLDVSSANSEVDAATTVEAVNAAILTIRNLLATYLGSAEVASPIDVTSVWIENAAPGNSGKLDYWVNSGNPTSQYNLYEYWNVAAGTTKQTLATSLPIGYYTLTAIAYTRDGMTATLNAGEATTNLVTVATGTVNDRNQGNNWIAAGNGVNKLNFSLDEVTANLVIGLTADNTSGDHWMCWRSFKLEYLGTDPFATYRIELADAVTAAEEVEEGSTTSAAYSALQTALSTYNKEWDNNSDWETAISAIETATTTATSLQTNYSAWLYMKTKVSAMTSVTGYTETTSGATTTLNDAITSANATVEAATTAEAIATQTAAVKAAGLTFLAGVRSDGAHPFDITFLIANPGFDNNNINGWTRTFDGGSANTRCHSNEFYDNNSFDFYQILTDMPKGNYELKVQAFQRPGFADAAYNAYLAGNTSTDAVVYINDGKTAVKHIAVDAQNDHLYWLNGGNYPDDSRVGSEGAYKYLPNSMEGAEVWFAAGHYDNSILTAVDGTLKLGFKADHKTADGTWTLFDNFRLYFYGQSINVAMSETEAFAALADIEGANVTMARTTKVGYNTVALPFDLTAEQVEEVFGAGAVVYAFSEDSEDPEDATVEFSTKAEQTIEANVPVLVKATATATQIVADNVTVKTGAAKVEGTNFDFVGNYSGQITLAEGIWFIGNGAVYESTGNTNMKGFRAYIEPKGDAEVKAISLFIDGLATSISEINGIEKAENGAIFNIAGQRVSKAQKGLYIMNGKKVIVK